MKGLIESQLATVDSKIKRSQSKLDDPIIVEKPREIVEKLDFLKSGLINMMWKSKDCFPKLKD